MNSTEVMHYPRVAVLKGAALGVRIVSYVLLAVTLLFVAGLILGLFEDARSFPYVETLMSIQEDIASVVHRVIPTRIGDYDATSWIIIVLTFFSSGALSRFAARLNDNAEYLIFKRNVAEWRKKINLPENSVYLSPLTRKLENLKTARKQDREQLLKEFAETKKKLDEIGRDLAFLSIDVVDSTGMKAGEERATIEHDFKEYKRFVERMFVAHGCLKSTWTPDGTMSCFTTVDAAVNAARAIINGLEQFNRNVKAMRRDFVVRCGVNSGFVYFDESVPLEEVSDRVIDVAGHFQKHAAPNTVAIAKPAIEPLNERNGFEPSGKVVDGYEVYEWKKDAGL